MPAVEESNKTQLSKYICLECGWVYDPAVGDPQNGVAAGTPFEEIPGDWRCPDCGVGKGEFVKI